LTVLFIGLGGDFGSAAIMVTLFALIFLKVPSDDKIISIIKVLAVLGIIGALVILKYSYLILPESVLKSDYRLNRLIYMNPCDRYEYDSGYQVCNGYIAINNGGLFGTGIGESVQKYLYLPASHTDFIFPIIVEELGVLVGIGILIGYMVITYYIFKIATNTYKLQNSIICYGIGVYFLLHIFVNLGGVLGLIPLTGIPLPFLSYGGSFCMTMICAFAIIQRINIENVEEKRQREIKKIVN
jgi:cell division protein FtsW